MQRRDQLDASDRRHLDIGQENISGVSLQPAQRLLAIAGGVDLMPSCREVFSKKLADLELIVDNEHPEVLCAVVCHPTLTPAR